MSNPLAPWTQKILDVLADGEPRTLDDLVRVVGPTIAPGMASRKGLALRHRNREYRGSSARTSTERDPVDNGRRFYVRDACHHLAAHGRITYTAGVAQLARRP